MTTLLTINVEPEWSNKVNCTFGFASVIATTAKLHEQRRALSEDGYISTSAVYHVRKVNAQKFFNILMFGKDKVFAVPVYLESLVANEINTSSIVFDDNLNYCFTLVEKGLENIFITNHNDLSELLTISEITYPSTITFTTSIVNTYNINNVFIYPAFQGIIKSMKKTDETDDFDIWRLEFQEYKPNG
jgi:hypothetical protein